MTHAIHTGQCLCGAIRYLAGGTPDPVTHCYCSMCRRQSGAAFVTFARFRLADVRWVAERPVQYRSSADAVRGFCGECGSTLTFAYDREPGHLWLTAGTLDRPERIHPTRECRVQDRIPWVVQ
jgi:hypothetical protein